jgi:4-carboxymuconolactone decarboxylase
MPASADEEREYQRAAETAGRLLGKPLVLPLGEGEPAVGEDFRRLATVATFGQSWPREGLDDRAFDSYQVALAVFAEAG